MLGVASGSIWVENDGLTAEEEEGENGITVYCIPINDTTFELSFFWLSDTESRINELRFSEAVSLSFKIRLTYVTCF